MWLNENVFSHVPEDIRTARVKHIARSLTDSRYGRHLTTMLAEAGALKDEELIPGLMKIASYQKENSDYDCRPKWMAVASLNKNNRGKK